MSRKWNYLVMNYSGFCICNSEKCFLKLVISGKSPGILMIFQCLRHFIQFIPIDKDMAMSRKRKYVSASDYGS